MIVNPELLAALLDTTSEFAKEMLEKCNDFYPFGASIGPDQQIGLDAAYDGDEHPDPRELYQMLVQGFSEGAANGKYIAVAIAANVNIPSEYQPTYPDGIRVLIESRDYSRFIYLPFRFGPVSPFARLLRHPRPVEYGEMFAVEVGHGLFTQ